MLREFPCKLFHTTGNCVNSDECMFSHDALNDDTQELLNKVRSSYSVPQFPQVWKTFFMSIACRLRFFCRLTIDTEVSADVPPDYGAALFLRMGD